MSFATHAVGFAVWGTVVRLAKDSHQLVRPTMVVSLMTSKRLLTPRRWREASTAPICSLYRA